MFEFEVICKKTRKPITRMQIHDIARENGLMEDDLTRFALTDCGQIILLDDFSNFCYLDMNKYTARIKVCI